MLLQKTLGETFGGSGIQHKPSFTLQPSSSRTFYGVFSLVADLLIGHSVVDQANFEDEV